MSQKTKTTDFEAYDSKPWQQHYGANTNHELPPPPFTTLVDLIRESAKKYSSHKAFTVCLPNGMTGTLTYREIDELSDCFAAYLRIKLRLAKGDTVAVQAPNCVAYPIAVFGILKAGCVVVNVNPLYTVPEMRHVLHDSKSKALVIIDMFRDKLHNALAGSAVCEAITVSVADFLPQRNRLIVKAVLHLQNKIPASAVAASTFMHALAEGRKLLKNEKPCGQDGNAGHATRDETVTMNASDVALLQYTGGTTGVSKGAELTHRNIIANRCQIFEMGRGHLKPGQDVILTAIPLYHIFAFTLNLITFFSLGAHNILIPSPRPITNLKKAFKKFPITWTTGVNTLYQALCTQDWFRANPPRHLRANITGGSPLVVAVAKKWLEITGSPVVEGYGMTEASPVITFNPLDAVPREKSIGIPVPDTLVRIVDPNENPVPVGEQGEILAKGPQVMHGYWRRPDETALVLDADGWLHTGDAAYMDNDGYFYIVDRMKDMILVSGFNVYPKQVEDVILTHPDVAECAVIGIPDSTTGEVVRAYVVSNNPNLSTEEIKKHCHMSLTGYKMPRSIVFRNELPKSTVGKILRRELRDEAKKEALRHSQA